MNSWTDECHRLQSRLAKARAALVDAATSRSAAESRLREVRLQHADAVDDGDASAISTARIALAAAERDLGASRDAEGQAQLLADALADKIVKHESVSRVAFEADVEKLRMDAAEALAEISAEWEAAAQPLARVATKLIALMNAVEGSISIFGIPGVSAETHSVISSSIGGTLDELLVAKIGSTGRFDRRDRLIDTDKCRVDARLISDFSAIAERFESLRRHGRLLGEIERARRADEEKQRLAKAS